MWKCGGSGRERELQLLSNGMVSPSGCDDVRILLTNVLFKPLVMSSILAWREGGMEIER